ncbi:unnamed protein product [Sphagnum troendelagicum]|uniref:Uncharacterized protein n=1 Tax=Sphagnum troendelagicum TaxID=128251 RepID=A0ABP0UVX7_9BRYO
MAGARQGSSLMGFIPKALRPTYSDIGAGVLWGGTALLGAIWVVQPFGWMKDQLFPPPKEEENVDCSGGFCSGDEEIPCKEEHFSVVAVACDLCVTTKYCFLLFLDYNVSS